MTAGTGAGARARTRVPAYTSHTGCTCYSGYTWYSLYTAQARHLGRRAVALARWAARLSARSLSL